MTAKNNIIVVGSSNTDMVITADHFPLPGETIIGRGFMTNQGGKGANQAVAAARLGGNVSFIGKVGTDSFGDNSLAALQKEGIDTSQVSRADGTPSGIAIITVDAGGENTIIVESGANALLSCQDIDRAEHLFASARIVLMQLETPIPTLIHAARTAKRHGAFVVLNPAPAPKEPLPAELLQNVDILIPNETEAAYISGIDITDDASMKKAMAAINRLGVKLVIITVGKRGVLTCIGDEMVNIPGFEAQAVDTTAAGDTFCAALCVALCQERELTEAIRFANKAASITVTRKGAQIAMPYLNEINI